MHVVALDTTTRTLTAATVRDRQVLAAVAGDPDRSQAEQLPGAIIRVLDAAGLGLGAIDLFAVAAGPGSFTGLRIGIATMQGCAFATGRPLVLISALEALAQSVVLAPGTVVASWMDARRRDVFSALYRVTDAAPHTKARLTELAAPMVASPGDTLMRWAAGPGSPGVIVGDGAVLYAQTIGARSRVLAPPPLAPVIGWLALNAYREGHAPPPHAAQPLYVRRPDAEVARDRQRAQPGKNGRG